MVKVLAMVKQLGVPTWFMTYADLRWPELFQIISRMQGKDEEVDALSFQRYIVRDISLARYF